MNDQNTNKSILNVEVSYLPSCTTVAESQTINLLRILMSSKHKGLIEEIRQTKSKEERDIKKRMLPAFMPSGVFSARTDDSLIKHSGLIGIDIDFKDNQHIANYSDLKIELIKIKHVAYCGLSASGMGYFCLITIAFPIRHRQHFKALARKFRELGIQIDTQCINVSRLRFVSYDPQAHFNHNAAPFFLLEEPEKPKFKPYSLHATKSEQEIQIERMVKAIEHNKVDITMTYAAWFPIACSLANSIGENGRDYFHRLSQYNPEYSYRRANYEYDKCMKSNQKYKYSLGTFFYHCKQAGIST